ncbi:hypothetical protein CGMCC3_g16979 [Colletotrichum fructicola]|nr:uncharacterized protein CGMCC3_g16979 [Colletotrichum fructicola]KAE9566874.1 hypothetical protein CGMCC3_g16979 [Colletotrichum fructicola]
MQYRQKQISLTTLAIFNNRAERYHAKHAVIH